MPPSIGGLTCSFSHVEGSISADRYSAFVLAANIPQVDVIPDGFDVGNIVVGVLGALGTIAALIVAIRAQRDATKARISVGQERRRQFELEILREFLRDVDEKNLVAQVIGNADALGRYQERLNLLDEADLPFWRRAMTTRDDRELMDAVGHLERMDEAANAISNVFMRYPVSGEQAELAGQHPARRREFEDEVRRRLLGDLHQAIRSRVDARDETKPPHRQWLSRLKDSLRRR